MLHFHATYQACGGSFLQQKESCTLLFQPQWDLLDRHSLCTNTACALKFAILHNYMPFTATLLEVANLHIMPCMLFGHCNLHYVHHTLFGCCNLHACTVHPRYPFHTTKCVCRVKLTVACHYFSGRTLLTTREQLVVVFSDSQLRCDQSLQTQCWLDAHRPCPGLFFCLSLWIWTQLGEQSSARGWICSCSCIWTGVWLDVTIAVLGKLGRRFTHDTWWHQPDVKDRKGSSYLKVVDKWYDSNFSFLGESTLLYGIHLRLLQSCPSREHYRLHSKSMTCGKLLASWKLKIKRGIFSEVTLTTNRSKFLLMRTKQLPNVLLRKEPVSSALMTCWLMRTSIYKELLQVGKEAVIITCTVLILWYNHIQPKQQLQFSFHPFAKGTSPQPPIYRECKAGVTAPITLAVGCPGHGAHRQRKGEDTHFDRKWLWNWAVRSRCNVQTFKCTHKLSILSPKTTKSFSSVSRDGKRLIIIFLSEAKTVISAERPIKHPCYSTVA